MKLFVIFVVLNVLNVIIQTVKSICTIKCGKVGAALINALAYGLYTIVLVYMSCELDLWTKAIVVALCNLIGVYVVKLIEEKMRKDKLWKIELTVKADTAESLEIEGFQGLLALFKCKVFGLNCSKTLHLPPDRRGAPVEIRIVTMSEFHKNG